MTNYWILARRTMLIFGLLPVLAGSLLALQGWYWKQQTSSFVDHLRQVEARVLRYQPTDDGTQIGVEYLNEDGVPFTKDFVVDSRQERELRAIGKVALVYDVRDPHGAHLGHVVSTHHELLLYSGMAAAGGLFIVFGFAVLGRGWRQVLGIQSLFRTGVLVRTEVRDTKLAPGGTRGRFTFAFRGPNGRWYEGKSPELGPEQLALWPVGKNVAAVYDPAHPHRSEADVFGVLESGRGDALPQD